MIKLNRLLLSSLYFALSLAHAAPCDPYLSSPYMRLVETSLQTAVLKIEDLRFIVDSETPVNPLALEVASADTVQIQKFFETLVRDPRTLDQWPSVRAELRARIAKSETEVIERDKARHETRETILLKEIWSEDVRKAQGLSWCRRGGKNELCYTYELFQDPSQAASTPPKTAPSRLSRQTDGVPRVTLGEFFPRGESATNGVFESDGALLSAESPPLNISASPAFTKSERRGFLEGERIGVAVNDDKYIMFVVHSPPGRKTAHISAFDLSDLSRPTRLQDFDLNLPRDEELDFADALVDSKGVVRLMLWSLWPGEHKAVLLTFDGESFSMDGPFQRDDLMIEGTISTPNAMVALEDGRTLVAIPGFKGAQVFQIRDHALQKLAFIPSDDAPTLNCLWITTPTGEVQLIVAEFMRLRIFQPLTHFNRVIHEQKFEVTGRREAMRIRPILGPESKFIFAIAVGKAVWLYEPSTRDLIFVDKSRTVENIPTPAWLRLENGDYWLAVSNGVRVRVLKVWDGQQ